MELSAKARTSSVLEKLSALRPSTTWVRNIEPKSMEKGSKDTCSSSAQNNIKKGVCGDIKDSCCSSTKTESQDAKDSCCSSSKTSQQSSDSTSGCNKTTSGCSAEQIKSEQNADCEKSMKDIKRSEP